VGLRDLRAQAQTQKLKAAKVAKPVFKQYREKDGKFYFKLVDAEGKLLLQSLGFDSPKEAGQTIGLLQTQGADALPALANQLVTVSALEADTISAALALMAEPD
jgi:tryptophanyl-tRNA synthetase